MVSLYKVQKVHFSEVYFFHVLGVSGCLYYLRNRYEISMKVLCKIDVVKNSIAHMIKKYNSIAHMIKKYNSIAHMIKKYNSIAHMIKKYNQ